MTRTDSDKWVCGARGQNQVRMEGCVGRSSAEWPETGWEMSGRGSKEDDFLCFNKITFLIKIVIYFHYRSSENICK